MQTILEINLPGIPSKDVEVTSTPLPNGNHTLKVKARNKYGQTLSDTWAILGKYDLERLTVRLELGVLSIEAPLKESLQPRVHQITSGTDSHRLSL